MMLDPVYRDYHRREEAFDDVFETENLLAQKCFMGVSISISGFCHNLLGQWHNEVAENPDNCSKGWTIVAIEMGFVATFLLGVVESVARFALALILAAGALLAAPLACFEKIPTSQMLLVLSVVNLLATPTHIGQSAVSIYTNLAYRNRKIDYLGQARYHLLCGSPET